MVKDKHYTKTTQTKTNSALEKPKLGSLKQVQMSQTIAGGHFLPPTTS